LSARGVVADLVPRRSLAAALAEAFPPGRGRVLLPQAALADDVLASGLTAKGWSVDVVEAYRTLPAVPPAEVAAAAAKADAVAFTSSSTVDNYVDAVGSGGVPPVVACIGPVTAATARRRGLDVTVVAEEQSVDGLAAAIASWFSGRGGAERS
ncbi:MAG TPA: uroporphyrinogen-III synthase, partial [Acidimicrobiales bacterium]|nr:uroporphyrinogen-III synthase [Acidimicrobiales bacterium]